MNILAAAVVRITRINPTTLDASDNTLLLVNGVCTNRRRLHPTAGSPPTSRCWHASMASQRPCLAVYYHTLVAGNNNSPVWLLDGLTRQDGTRGASPAPAQPAPLPHQL
ncbi:hypothetical protein B0H14DRAFT_3516771 [Mycena olivaceomarginata]|nr:hypothetical protein B0H14DRAFT_3516771 [Mycena olivaceomarginata]